MLAQTARTSADALARIHPAEVEWKLDGARLQVHVSHGDVRAFARTLADVTDRVPEIVEEVSRSRARNGRSSTARRSRSGPTAGRTRSRSRAAGSRAALDVDGQRRSVPLSPFFFDLLHVDGEDLIDRPAARADRAAGGSPPRRRSASPGSIAEDAGTAERFLDDALAHGHEGVMVKSLDAPYEAGRRGAGWLKVKRAHTLDLVVLAAEWGHGRRQGWLSNLHLGARDPAGGFVMLGKTFKGMTDEMLAWQTERLLALETSRDGDHRPRPPRTRRGGRVRRVQASTRYPAGVALRFARVKGYRHDKRPEDADTIDTVLAIHRG